MGKHENKGFTLHGLLGNVTCVVVLVVQAVNALIDVVRVMDCFIIVVFLVGHLMAICRNVWNAIF